MVSNKVNPLLRDKFTSLKYAVVAIGALALNFGLWSGVFAHISNPGLFQWGAVTAGHCTSWGPGAGQLQDAGAACAATPPSPANPTATAGPAAVNGAATTYMRSDAAPAVQLATNAQKGIAQVDGTTITAAAGVISTPGAANPTASATTAAVNGVAATFMRSDAAPAVAVTTFGGQTVGPGGTAGVQGNGAKIQLSTGAIVSGNCVKFDANGNTVDNGAACGGATGANPTATAADTAVNGVATTFMRSDAAPAVQKGTNAAFGLAEGDNLSASMTAGVVSTIAASKAQQQTGTDNNVNVKPAHQQDHDSAAKAWASITGSTGAIQQSYNVSGVVRTGAGQYTVSFTTAFAAATYMCQVTSEPTSVATASAILTGVIPAGRTTGSVQLYSVNTSATVTDPTSIYVICFGRQ